MRTCTECIGPWLGERIGVVVFDATILQRMIAWNKLYNNTCHTKKELAKELENLLALYQASTNADDVQQMEVQRMDAEIERERATQPEPYIEPDRHGAY